MLNNDFEDNKDLFENLKKNDLLTVDLKTTRTFFKFKRFLIQEC
jgi:hypothetical protein